MIRTIKTAGRIVKQSTKAAKTAKMLCDEKPKSSQSFIAAAKSKSESYQRIQKMRDSVKSK